MGIIHCWNMLTLLHTLRDQKSSSWRLQEELSAVTYHKQNIHRGEYTTAKKRAYICRLNCFIAVEKLKKSVCRSQNNALQSAPIKMKKHSSLVKLRLSIEMMIRALKYQVSGHCWKPKAGSHPHSDETRMLPLSMMLHSTNSTYSATHQCQVLLIFF